MLKLELDEFIFEVKDEISCYEEIGTEGADKWEADFRKWINSPIKKKNVIIKNSKVYFCIEDESEIFDIADSYIESIEQNKTEEYWKKFQ